MAILTQAPARPIGWHFRRSYMRSELALLGVTGLLSFIGAWELVGRLALVNPLAISSPARVVDALQRQVASGDLARAIFR